MTKQAAKNLRMCVIAAAASILCSSASAAPADTTRVIVAFKPGAKMAMKSLAASANATVKSEIFGTDAVAMEVPRTALKGLENNPNVEYIEEDHKRYAIALTTPSTGTPYATGQAVPYGIKQVQKAARDHIASLGCGN